MRAFKTLAILGLAIASGAQAQIISINSVVTQPRAFNDIPGATLTTAVGINTSHPWLSFTEAGVSAPSGFANRDVFRYSNNGINPYSFGHAEFFTASFSLTLTDSADSPRKEAGFLLSSTSVGDVQFFVNSDGHEVVQVGGSSFFSFNSTYGLTYHTGQTIDMSLSYTVDPVTGANALRLGAGLHGDTFYYSPYLDFGPGHGNGSPDIGDLSTLGGYFQIVNAPNDPNNTGTARFSDITIVPVPEPTVFALAGFGALAVLIRRRTS